MQAFSACFMKFCLALNSYIFALKSEKGTQAMETWSAFPFYFQLKVAMP